LITFQTIIASCLHAGLTWLSRQRLPQTRGTLRLRTACLRAPVEILRDRWGVPHIYARNVHDLMFAQGFVHAQDRLWQMDFQRRLVAGRLSEVIGAATLDVDRWLRILSLRRVAEAEVALVNGEPRAALNAYVEGVNAHIARGPLPIEFTLLRYRPEPWTVADTLSWPKMLSWMLSVNWESELLRAQLITRLGPERAAELEPAYFGQWPTIVPSSALHDVRELHSRTTGSEYNSEPSPPSPGLHDVRELHSRTTGSECNSEPSLGLWEPCRSGGLGSNNWVIAGSRTATGAALLANDMHLLMGTPAIWYENHLVSQSDPAVAHPLQGTEPNLHVTGVTFPGIPGVVAGHNAHVAWGFTNGFPDVQDLYVEHLRRTADGRVQYEYCGAWLDAQVRYEEIRVKAAPPVVEEVIVTRHGPIIDALASDLTACPLVETSQSARPAGAGLPWPDWPSGQDGLTVPPGTVGDRPERDIWDGIALRWTALEPDWMTHALYAMNRARDCLEFRQALREWAAPVQNVVYADTAGDIGYSFPGRVPIRAKGDGRVPVPGWTGEYEWVGYVPFEELPHLLNPPQGYIATANNRVVGDDYPYPLGSDFCVGDRAQRIVELIESRPQVDIPFIRQMQFDQVSPTGRVVAGYLGGLAADDPELAAVVQIMRDWDGHLAADSPAAAVHEVFVRRMIALLLADKLGELTVRYAGKGPTPQIAEGSMFGHRSWEWLQKVLAEPESPWFAEAAGAGLTWARLFGLTVPRDARDQVMRLALRQTVDFLKAELGPKPADWAWGKLHTLTYSHVLGSVPPLDRLFNRGPYPLGGDGTTVWATGASQHDLSSQGVIGPPYRFIVDLGDLRNSLALLAPGQSGHPASPHYGDQIAAWFTGGYHPMLWEREDVERQAVGRLELQLGQGKLPFGSDSKVDMCRLLDRIIVRS
jgi:penicillin amidase